MPKVVFKKIWRIAIFLMVAVLIWYNWTPSVNFVSVLQVTAIETKILLIYTLAILLLPLSSNILVVVAIIVLILGTSGELGGLVIFMTLLVVLFKSPKVLMGVKNEKTV